MHPALQSFNQIDQLRSNEYFHLNKPESKVCLDYCGFGLFSYLQRFQLPESCAFSLSAISSNLRNHALYGSAVEGTAENDIRTRIMDYLNTPENEYSLVFTASRGAAFRLLAENYPFKTNRKLLTMFDHESQSVNWMAQRARDKGAKVHSAKFMWPSLMVCSSEMIKLLSSKKRRKKSGSATGLFVFPVQSRVSGVKYAYKWMALAKQYRWHVLLDAGSLGPKDMESFGLSLFRPDFIITSFYRGFGSDPSGFGCLLIKKSVMNCLNNRGDDTGLGIVRIVSVFPHNLSEFAEDGDCFDGDEDDAAIVNEEKSVLDASRGSKMAVFSGLYPAPEVRDPNEIDQDSDSATYEASNINEETDSLGEIMKSPIFSDDESSHSSPWINLGPSPTSGSKNRQRLLSFDKSILSVSADENQIEKDSNGEHLNILIQEDIDKEDIENAEDTYESAIRRETEFEFTLFGRREANHNESDLNPTPPSKSLNQYLDSGESSSHNSDDRRQDDSGDEDDREPKRREPEIACRHIDHINMIDMNKAVLRIRYLVNWLVGSLLHLRVPGSYGERRAPLVCIYGPKIKHERGATVAFNVRDRGGGLIHAETVQKLAERNGIYLGVGFLSNINFNGSDEAVDSSLCHFISTSCREIEDDTVRLEVLIASIGFLTNFADVYKLWAFVAQFVDPSFIEMSET